MTCNPVHLRRHAWQQRTIGTGTTWVQARTCRACNWSVAVESTDSDADAATRADAAAAGHTPPEEP